MKTYTAILLIITFMISSASAGVQWVTTPVWGYDTVAGSISYAIKNASPGDEIRINLPPQDTIIAVNEQISISKDLTISGINMATGRRIILNHNYPPNNNHLVNVTGGNAAIRDAILWGSWINSDISRGGVVYVKGVTTRLLLNNVEVTYGMASAGGGGIFNDSGDVTIVNCNVFENYSNGGGGGICNSFGKMTIENSIISNNDVHSGSYYDGHSCGGGIFNQGSLAVSGSTISNNTCDARNYAYSGDILEYAYGGGLYNTQGVASLINCTICNNTSLASCPYSHCSAFCDGGGVYNDDYGLCFLTYCTVAGNTPGGVGTDYSASVCLLNNLVVKNSRYDISNSDTYYDNFYGEFNMATVIPDSGIAAFDRKLTLKAILGKDSITAIGGPVPFIPLYKNAAAIGSGIRCGYYLFDTVLVGPQNGFVLTARKPVCFREDSWLDLLTNFPAPAGVSVVEITADQRGVRRANPPCLGAFEYDSSVQSIMRVLPKTPDARVKFLSLRGDRLTLTSAAAARVELTLFDARGRMAIRFASNIRKGFQEVGLPCQVVKGVYILKAAYEGFAVITRIFAR
jgi:hypothetical protein